MFISVVLPLPDAAHDRHVLAALDGQADAAQRVHGDVADGVGLGTSRRSITGGYSRRPADRAALTTLSGPAALWRAPARSARCARRSAGRPPPRHTAAAGAAEQPAPPPPKRHRPETAAGAAEAPPPSVPPAPELPVGLLVLSDRQRDRDHQLLAGAAAR